MVVATNKSIFHHPTESALTERGGGGRVFPCPKSGEVIRPHLVHGDAHHKAAALHAKAQALTEVAMKMGQQIYEQEQAAGAMDQLLNLLGDLEPPEALRELKMATMDDADAPTIRALLYKLVIVQQLDYNLLEGDEPRLEEAKFDFKNKDDAELVGRMQYVYSYGIKMFQAGMITEEALKPIILDELCARVGMTGEELDQWLAMPAAK